MNMQKYWILQRKNGQFGPVASVLQEDLLPGPGSGQMVQPLHTPTGVHYNQAVLAQTVMKSFTLR